MHVDNLVFQFTHPGKGATHRHQPNSFPPGKFQFTHPGKGATDLAEVRSEEAAVSIHAPWEGCDTNERKQGASYNEFQFTHPGKGATLMSICEDQPPKFQFTHPGKGATTLTITADY